MIVPWSDAHPHEIARLLDVVRPDDPLARVLADVHGPDRDGDGRFRRSLVAARADRIVGVGTVWEADLHPARWRLSIQVHPSARREGVGTALLNVLLALGTARDHRPFQAATRADNAAGMGLLRRQAFAPLMRTRIGRLDPAAMAADDGDRFDAMGYRVVAFPDRPVVVSAQSVADIHAEAYARSHATWNPVRPLDAAERIDLFLGDDLIPDALFLALAGDEVAGFGSLRAGAGPGDVDLGWVGVATGHEDRAKSIISAVVGRCLDRARRDGMVMSVEVDDADLAVSALLDTLPIGWEPDWLAFARPGPPTG